MRGQGQVVPDHGVVLARLPVGRAAHALPQPQLGHAQAHGAADGPRHELAAQVQPAHPAPRPQEFEFDARRELDRQDRRLRLDPVFRGQDDQQNRHLAVDGARGHQGRELHREERRLQLRHRALGNRDPQTALARVERHQGRSRGRRAEVTTAHSQHICMSQ